MIDVVPAPGLRLPISVLAERQVHYLETVQVMEAVEYVYALAMVPWEPLRGSQTMIGCPRV